MAQLGLSAHLVRTQRALRDQLRTLDRNADCEILPAADLGVPYDVLRLAGGFATGCFVQWRCTVPIVPIDITMNIDTSSVFWVDDTAADRFNEAQLASTRTTIEGKTGYLWNLDESNHFI